MIVGVSSVGHPSQPVSTNSPSLYSTSNNHPGGKNDIKHTFSYVISLGSGVFLWFLKEQQTIAQSSAKAECVLTSLATSHTI